MNLPLPEMTFGNNSLVLTYDPSGSGGTSSAPTKVDPGSAAPVDGSTDVDGPVTLAFNALEALAGVATGEGWEERVGGGVKVSMAEQWGKNRYVSLVSQHGGYGLTAGRPHRRC